ncbi:leucine-rich repeat-containing protein 57-like [Planococcus citri]|uniref:leucine-rich repeat-containing protein 57-like n=1 Tax=Planococcus citri TaxID=170843 RepID=UPI0031F7549D
MGNSNTKHHYETAKKTGTLSLCNSSLNELPSKLKELHPVLRQLNLSSNKFQTLPPSISNFSNLKYINVDYNKLTQLPEEIGRLQKLENLSAAANSITSIPHTFSSLVNLKEIHLNNNLISDFPTSLCDLKHLTIIDISHNKIDMIPDSIKRIYAIEFNLNDNNISIISPEIANAPKLKILKLENNNLTLSAIPKSLLCDSKVTSLFVQGNQFDIKEFEHLDGYEKYQERYTETKKKLF